MKKNMGKIDRIVRVIIGLALLVIAIVIGINSITWIPIVLGILGIVLLATSAMSFCPLYLPFGISTNKESST